MDVFQALLKTMPGLQQGQWRKRLTRKKSSERKMIYAVFLMMFTSFLCMMPCVASMAMAMWA